VAGPKNLLVISYHFPPDQSVGGLRWGGLTKYLARRGWDVHVVTAAQGADGESTGGSVKVHGCRPYRTVNDGYNAAAAAWRGKRSGGKPAAERPPDTAPSTSDGARRMSTLRRVRTEVSQAISLPDYARGWVLPAGLKARSLVRSERIQAVVTSGPPHSAHLAGLIATFGRPDLLTIDMRDPWAGLDASAWGHADSHLARWLIPRLERLVFSRARRVIGNTAEFAATLRRSRAGVDVEFIPNGVDTDQLPDPMPPPSPGLTVVHIGTLYGGRDLTPVLAAMRDLFDRVPEARPPSRLVVAGSLNTERARHFKQRVIDLAMEDVVDIRGVIPRAEALELLQRAHLALVLAQNQPMQVPAKLFESLGLEVPTLVITESDSATAQEGRRLGAFVHTPEDIAGMSDVMGRIWQGEGLRIPPKVPISYESLAARMEAVLLETGAGESQ
jgi:glycosyltransferase involved in cell wall biosynthesis